MWVCITVHESRPIQEIPSELWKLRNNWTLVPYDSITVGSDMIPICYVISKAMLRFLWSGKPVNHFQKQEKLLIKKITKSPQNWWNYEEKCVFGKFHSRWHSNVCFQFPEIVVLLCVVRLKGKKYDFWKLKKNIYEQEEYKNNTAIRNDPVHQPRFIMIYIQKHYFE